MIPCRPTRAFSSLPVRSSGLAALATLVFAAGTYAQNWDEVGFVRHDVYQAVQAGQTGGYTNAYVGPFPTRLRGVVLNNTEDWLDPTAAYDSGFHMLELGGQAEFYIQAVDLSGDSWDDGDFGGTACWMGQNYGNLPWKGDSDFSYTDPQWYGELDRLQLWHEGTSVSPLVRAGDLVEVRAQAGLYYNGKMNVNEQHNNTINDFEIVILEKNYGLPAAASISLDAIKNAANEPIFDPDRNAGGERYQSTLVEIQNVRLVDAADWVRNGDPVVTDDTGRTLQLHLGLSDSFDAAPPPEGLFNVVGIMDQNSSNGMSGYRLLAMHAGDIVSVPEPATLLLLATGAATLLIGVSTRRR